MKLTDLFSNLFRKSLGYSIRSTPLFEDLTFNKDGYFNLHEITLFTNRGIQKRAQKVGQTKFVLTKDGEEVEEHPILDLLDRPNDHQTGVQFWSLASEYRDVSGFAVIRMITKGENEVFRNDKSNVISLELLNSSRTQINYDGNKIRDFTETKYDGTQETIPFNECIYWIKPDPKTPTEGISLLKAGIFSIDTDNQLSKYQNAIVKNGGRADSIMTFKNDPTDAQVEAYKNSFIKERRDPKNSDIPYFLGGEATMQRLGMTPAELAYLESRKLYAKDLVIITGVPLSILGYAENSTFDNAGQDYKNFLRETIKPIVEDLINMLNWKLVPMEYELTYVDPSPEDVDVKVKIINALYSTDASTINERREIMGLDRVDDPKADELLVSYSKQPLGYEEPTYKEELDTEDDDTETKQKGIKQIHYLLRDKSFRDMYRKVAKKKTTKNEAIFKSMIGDYFTDQEKRILSSLTDEKALVTKALVDDVLNESLEIKIASERALPLLQRFLKEAGVEAMELLDAEDSFDISRSIKSWLTKRSNLFAKEITATTYDKLKNEFAESFAQGENRSELVNRIKEVYDQFDENRAKTIARTETHGAMQKGNFEGSKQAGSPIKIWVSVLDDVTRDSHASLDGEEVDIDKRFSNGLMFAGDPSGDGSETINCRCSTV